MHLTFTLFVAAVFSSSPSLKSPRPNDTEGYLKLFDDFEFGVFNKQQWDHLEDTHSENVVVIWPDGHKTKGLEIHIEELKAMFAWAPDTRILEHPVKFGDQEWTAVTGVMTGTFTNPMPLPGGKTLQPTNKSFKLSMVTIGRWRDGKMFEKELFWDNGELMKQLGVTSTR